MAVEPVNRLVAALVSGGSSWATISAKAASATIPLGFPTGNDPVKLGFLANLNRPGGNVTGVSFLAAQLLAKRLELASQLVPKVAAIGFLGRPREPRYAADRKEIETAAATLGRKLLFVDVVDDRDLESAFATAAGQHIGVRRPHNDPLFNTHRSALIALEARHALPIVYEYGQPISNEARAKHPLMRCVKCPCAGGLSFNEARSTVLLQGFNLERAMRSTIIIRWQSGAIALTAIIFAFLVPGVALCKVVSLISIAAAIAITTLVVGFGLYLTGRLVERRTPRCEQVDHFLQASIFVIAAGLLWLHVVLQTGPWRERSIEPQAALAIVTGCGLAGGPGLVKRARRGTGEGAD